MMLKRTILAAIAAVMLMSGPALAVQPHEILDDPVLEERAREVGKALRCIVCQNQSIDDSDAELAQDMRVLVRERITAGDSNKQVIDYVVSRYGDYVLLKPPFKMKTLALWIGPAVIFIGGLFGIWMFYRGREEQVARNTGAAKTAKPLTDEERAKLDALLKED